MNRKFASFLKTNFLLIFLVTSYLLLVFGSVQLTRSFEGVTLLWPGSGVAFLLLSIFGARGGTLLYFLSSYFFYKIYGDGALALIHAIGPLLHAICAVATFRFFKRHFEEVGRFSEALGVVAAIILGVGVGALWTISVLILSGRQFDEMAIYNSIQNWTLSGSVGMLLFVPFFNFKLTDVERIFRLKNIDFEFEKKVALWGVAVILICLGIFLSGRLEGVTEIFVVWNLTVLICYIVSGAVEAYLAYLALALYHLLQLFEFIKEELPSHDILKSSVLEVQMGLLCVGLLHLIVSKVSQKKTLILSSFVLVLFWAGTFFFSRYYEVTRQKRLETEFQILTEKSVDQLKEFLEKYNLLVSFVGHEVGLQKNASKAQWAEFVTSMKLESNFSGIVEVGVFYADGGSEDGYKQGSSTSDIPIIQSLDRSSLAREVLKKAILRSKNLNTSVVSNFFSPRDRENNKLFFYLNPNYRADSLVGWGYLLLDWNQLLKSYKDQMDRRLDFTVYTGNFSPEYRVFGNGEKPSQATLNSFSRIYFSNHSLYVDWYLTPEVLKGESRVELIFVTSTSLAALLVFLVFVILIEAKDNANRLVDRKEKELRQSQLQLLQASKMTAVGEMAAGIAHEINNPLAIIKGRIGILESIYSKHADGDGIGPSMKEGFQIINRTVDRISKIIEGLRTFSRQSGENVPFQELNLIKVIDDTLDLCRERFKSSGVKLEVVVSDAVILGSDTQLSQVFLNLLNNAFDAVVGTENAWVRVEALSSEQVVCLRIFDSGKGIPDEVAVKMMAPFYTTKEVGKGTGLGLSISNEIIKRHQGALFYNKEFPNTCFEIRLPVKPRA